MADYRLSALLELKSNMTSGLQGAVSGLRNLERTAKVTSSSLAGLDRTYRPHVDLQDNASSKVRKLRSDLSSIEGRRYSAHVDVQSNIGSVRNQIKNTMSELGNGLMMGTGMQMAGAAGMGFAAYDTIKTAMDFEQQMKAVQAISGATGEDFEKLSAKAREMGSITSFTATESGKALEYMAMAGWKTDQMMSGLPGIMNLAAASGEELGLVSDIVTDALTAMNMKAEDAGHFADVLAAASSNSNTNIAMMGYTFKYAAPLAGALGYSIEDVALATGLMANAGIKADTAGTALRSTFTRLIAPPKQAAAALEELGLSLKDESGQMRPFRDILRELRQDFKGMTKDQKVANAEAIAGKYAMSGFLAMMNASDADFEKLANAVDTSAGKAEEMSKIRLDNLAGDVKLLASAWESFQLSLMDGTATNGLRSFTQELKSLVEFATNRLKDGLDFSDVGAVGVKVVKDLAGKFIQLDGVGSILAGGALVAGLAKIISMVNRAKTALKGMAAAGAASSVVPNVAPVTGPAASVGSMVVNAGSVVVNGKAMSGPAAGPGAVNAGGAKGAAAANGVALASGAALAGGAAAARGGTSGIILPGTSGGAASRAGSFAGGEVRTSGGIILPSSATAPVAENVKSNKNFSSSVGEFAKGAKSMAKTSGLMAGAFAAIDVATSDDKAEAAARGVGSIGGAVLGTALGAALGSVVPGLGTAIGAQVGGMIGGMAGGYLGGQQGEQIYRNIAGPTWVNTEVPHTSTAGTAVSKSDSGVQMDAEGNTWWIKPAVSEAEPAAPEDLENKRRELEESNRKLVLEAREKYGLGSAQERDAQSYVATVENGKVVNRRISGDNDEYRIGQQFESEEDAQIWFAKNREFRDRLNAMQENHPQFLAEREAWLNEQKAKKEDQGLYDNIGANSYLQPFGAEAAKESRAEWNKSLSNFFSNLFSRSDEQNAAVEDAYQNAIKNQPGLNGLPSSYLGAENPNTSSSLGDIIDQLFFKKAAAATPEAATAEEKAAAEPGILDTLLNGLDSLIFNKAAAATPEAANASPDMAGLSEAMVPPQEAQGLPFNAEEVQGQVEALKTSFSEMWASMTQAGAESGASLSASISESLAGVSASVAEQASGLSASLSETWAGITAGAGETGAGIMATFSEAWTAITTGAGETGTNVSTSFITAQGEVEGAWSGVSGFFAGIFSDIMAGASNAASWVSSQLSAAASAASGFASSAFSFVTGGGAPAGATGFSSFRPNAYATGGIVSFALPGLEHGLAQINEHGGELVDLPEGSRVYPADKSSRIIHNEVLDWLADMKEKYMDRFLSGQPETMQLPELSSMVPDFGGFPEMGSPEIQVPDIPDFPAMQTVSGDSAGQAPVTAGGQAGGAQITITGNTFEVRNEQDINKVAYQLMQLITEAQFNYNSV